MAERPLHPGWRYLPDRRLQVRRSVRCTRCPGMSAAPPTRNAGLRRGGACHVGAALAPPSAPGAVQDSAKIKKVQKKFARHLTGLARLVTARYRTFRPLRPSHIPPPRQARQHPASAGLSPPRCRSRACRNRAFLSHAYIYPMTTGHRCRLHFLALRLPDQVLLAHTGPLSCMSRRCSSPSSTTCARSRRATSTCASASPACSTTRCANWATAKAPPGAV